MQRKALIYKPSKSATQSGMARTQGWAMEFQTEDKKFVEPLMGWIGSRDTTRQLHLRFDSEAEAIAYAQEHGLPYEIREPKMRVIRPKSYASNFATNLRKYSD